MHIPELLAPAGDTASIQAAIDGGADAVYVGIGTFNMRRAVDGKITYEMLPQIAEQLHTAGLKLYLTVNTIIYQGELDELNTCLKRALGHVDAVICSDWAVITQCKALGIPVHISTQMSCTNATTARFLASQGAERVVLARECTLEEIEAIIQASGVEVEVFIHGAQCIATSGRCFLSHLAYGCSANRGACRQPCRREYEIHEIQDGEGSDATFVMGRNYILSARDVCGLSFVERLVKAGVSSLKIEGRARNPEYVLTVVRAYRRALTAIAEEVYTPELQAELLAEVSKVYHRPFAEGMLFGRPGDQQFCDEDVNQATEKKLYLGIIRNYFQRPQVADLWLHDHDIKPGDRIAIHGATTGVIEYTVPQLYRENEAIACAVRGEWTTFICPHRLRQNDKVYKLVPVTPDGTD